MRMIFNSDCYIVDFDKVDGCGSVEQISCVYWVYGIDR